MDGRLGTGTGLQTTLSPGRESPTDPVNVQDLDTGPHFSTLIPTPRTHCSWVVPRGHPGPPLCVVEGDVPRGRDGGQRGHWIPGGLGSRRVGGSEQTREEQRRSVGVSELAPPRPSGLHPVLVVSEWGVGSPPCPRGI